MQVCLNTTALETIAIKLNNNMLIVSCYNPPQGELNKRDLQKIMNLNNQVIIAGNLNAKHNFWNCVGANKNGNILFE